MAISKKAEVSEKKAIKTVKAEPKKEEKVVVAAKAVKPAVKAEPVVKAVAPKAVAVSKATVEKKAKEKCACEAKKASPEAVAPASKEENLKKLSKAGIVADFVKEMNGCWNHQAWLEFCASIEKDGYSPIDFDQVGLLLESEKAVFFAEATSCSCKK